MNNTHTHYSQLRGRARSDFHRSLRRPSTNDSHTIRHFNQDGIVDYCFIMHESFHGHGYIEEFILNGDTLSRRVSHENGIVHVKGGMDATCWKQTQRLDLLLA